MTIDIKIPAPGESVSEVVLAKWLVNDNDFVEKNQDIAEIESDKATISLVASESGKIHLVTKAGETVAVGVTACSIDTSAEQTTAEPVKPVVEEKNIPPKAEQSKAELPAEHTNVKITPLAGKLMQEYNLSVDDIIKGLQRITTHEVELVKQQNAIPAETKKDDSNKTDESTSTRAVESVPMSPLRKKLSERLVAVKNETAMLTTFNEVDMSRIMEIRTRYQDSFVKKHGVKIGFLPFFVKASALALSLFPEVNAAILGDNVEYHNFADIAIAVQSPKGLLVPVIRNAEQMSLLNIELKIKEFGEKASKNKLSLEELSGGTFTITNGGVFGSLFSTPIINPPQSGILGMHNIVERPVAVSGKVEIRPMMYIALSYDHRLIDGKSAVSFLVKIKEMIEKPETMLFQGKDPLNKLLDL